MLGQPTNRTGALQGTEFEFNVLRFLLSVYQFCIFPYPNSVWFFPTKTIYLHF